MSEVITPRGEPNGMVYYGTNGLNVDSFGLDSETFLELHREISQYGLKVQQPWPGVQIRFILYCHSLLRLAADIKVLVSEFNHAQLGDGSDTAHALSLTKLAYHYVAAGNNVEVIKTDQRVSRPDIVIDSVACELKVRLDQIEVRMARHRNLLFNGRHEEYHNLYFDEIYAPKEDLRRALLAAEVGFRQGDCVFLDLSSHFHSWNYHRLASGMQDNRIRGLYNRPIPPAPGTCILFSPDNALNRANRGFHPRAYWGYLPESP